MMDYMLPKPVMSWNEAFELYFEDQMLGGLFPDLEYYGIKPPRHVDDAIAEKDKLSHEIYRILHNFSFAAALTTQTPSETHMAWLSEQYPRTFDRYYRPVWEKHRRIEASGGRVFFQGLPQLCQVCQVPIAFSEAFDPTQICLRRSEFRGETFHTCSDGCKWIFGREPEKYVQAWLPVHQIHQGDCGGRSIPEVLAWYGIQDGDNGEYKGSPDQQAWASWHADAAGQ
jgi:phenol/toluene 2-monooxygenase (NADH) P3/A3